MITVLPMVLLECDIQRIIAVSGHSHHDDEGGHIRAKKPYRMSWLAHVIQSAIQFGTVDPNVQVYRLSGKGSSVPLHTDENFYGPNGTVARYSVLLKLNSDYTGGETRFNGELAPHMKVGDGILFSHNIPHEGLPVISGEKLILKTDIFV